MARNPKQDANLRPIKKGELSKEEAKRRGSKGGKTRAANARMLKTFSAAVGERLTEEKQKKMLDRLELLVLRGNLQAWDLYLKLLKQHPDQGGGEDGSVDGSVNIRIEGCDEYGD